MKRAGAPNAQSGDYRWLKRTVVAVALLVAANMSLYIYGLIAFIRLGSVPPWVGAGMLASAALACALIVYAFLRYYIIIEGERSEMERGCSHRCVLCVSAAVSMVAALSFGFLVAPVDFDVFTSPYVAMSRDISFLPPWFKAFAVVLTGTVWVWVLISGVCLKKCGVRKEEK